MTQQIETDVMVVGLGAVGSALVYQLAKRGVSVVGVEQFAAGHAFGSSHGESRITREFVGEGHVYVPLVRRSHRIWAELEARGYRLREKTGMLILAPGERPSDSEDRARRHGVPDFLKSSFDVARTHGFDAPLLRAPELRRRFPQFNVSDDTVGYFEPEGGFVRPEACIAAQQAEAAKHPNATLRYGTRMTGLARQADAVVVATTQGSWRARRVVLTAGAWIPGLAGGHFREDLQILPQVQYWFAPSEPELWAADRAPTFIWFHGPSAAEVMYGFPRVAGGVPGVKVATEQYERTADANSLAQFPDRPLDEAPAAAAGAEAMFRQHIEGRLNGISATPLQAVTCLYTYNHAQAGRFMIGPHPAVSGVTVVSACSGHGFKHSAGLGEALAESLTGRPAEDLAPFAA